MTAGKRSRLSTRLRRSPTRYLPISRIAVGGMAEVWKAEAAFEGGDRHVVAIKRVKPEIAGQPVYLSMFQDEARLGMLLRHPNIVRVYDAREVAGTFIMVMELVDGISLKGLLDGAFARQRAMPVAPALYISRQLAGALAYAHCARAADGTPLGVIHRDVSPHNLLLGSDGCVKLTDFGLADANINVAAVGDGLLGGKFGYLAPEIVRQQRGDHRVDIFAFGVVLWEMLAGRRLFVGESDADTVRRVAAAEVPDIQSLNASVPDSIAQLLRHALASEPASRIESAEELMEILDGAIREVDPGVGGSDVRLLVALTQASGRLPEPVAEFGFAALLEQEMDAFAAAGGEPLGAQALDPDDFDMGPVRVRRFKPR
ncbi:MAG: serine/threonine protein kinase [Deltaproteobacteria bacterium]|nr:serine/threonine protein kinase [Deltaproteobacteria bacterium]